MCISTLLQVIFMLLDKTRSHIYIHNTSVSPLKQILSKRSKSGFILIEYPIPLHSDKETGQPQLG